MQNVASYYSSSMLLLSGQPLSLSQIAAVADASAEIRLAPSAIARMQTSCEIVHRAAEGHYPVYGINTGFGKLCDVAIPCDQLSTLQLNLVRSHACGLGTPLSEPETRAIMALRANTLALGYSGVRPEIAHTLTLLLNCRVHPLIPSKGSVGASGDLAPLAHLALCMIGEGEALHQGQPIGAQGHNDARLRLRQRCAEAAGVAAHQVQLQARELAVRDAHFAEFAEAGIDAVDGEGIVRDAAHHGARGVHLGDGGMGDLHTDGPSGYPVRDLGDFVQREGLSTELQHSARIITRAGRFLNRESSVKL